MLHGHRRARAIAFGLRGLGGRTRRRIVIGIAVGPAAPDRERAGAVCRTRGVPDDRSYNSQKNAKADPRPDHAPAPKHPLQGRDLSKKPLPVGESTALLSGLGARIPEIPRRTRRLSYVAPSPTVWLDAPIVSV